MKSTLTKTARPERLPGCVNVVAGQLYCIVEVLQGYAHKQFECPGRLSVGRTNDQRQINEPVGVSHSLSYQPLTFAMLPMAMVKPASKVHEAGDPKISEETSGASL